MKKTEIITEDVTKEENAKYFPRVTQGRLREDREDSEDSRRVQYTLQTRDLNHEREQSREK